MKLGAHTSFFVKLLVTLVLIAALIAFIDLGVFAHHLDNVRWAYVVGAGLCVLLAILLSAWKWGLLLRARGYPLPFGRLMRHYFVGLFFNNVLPSTVGGDAVRAWETAKDIDNTPEAVGSVITERLIAGIGLGLTAALGLPFLDDGASFVWLVALFLAINGSLAALLIVPKIADGVARSLIPSRADRLQSTVVETIRVVREGFSRPALVGTVLVASIVFQVFVAAVNYCLFAAFNVEVSLAACVLLTPMAFTVTMIPVSLSGIGVREGAYAFFFALVGVSTEAAVLVSLAFFVLVAIASLPGAIFFIKGRRTPKGALEDAA